MRLLRHLAVSFIMLGLVASCDRSSPPDDSTTTETSKSVEAAPATKKEVPVPFKATDYLVVERYVEDDPDFPSYRTHHIAVAPDGYVKKETREGFHVKGKKAWQWEESETLVKGARDCSCEAFSRGSCSPDATMTMASLKPAEGNDAEAWTPSVYDEAKGRDVALWTAKSATAWLQGNILFTSVCADQMTCGKGSKTLCKSEALDISKDELTTIPLEEFGGEAVAELLKKELEDQDKDPEEAAALKKALEEGAEPTLDEVQPNFDGTIRRRWVVPSRYASHNGWRTDRASAWDEVPASGPLAIYARIPRPVSIFAPTLDGEMVGWTDGSFAEKSGDAAKAGEGAGESAGETAD